MTSLSAMLSATALMAMDFSLKMVLNKTILLTITWVFWLNRESFYQPIVIMKLASKLEAKKLSILIKMENELMKKYNLDHVKCSQDFFSLFLLIRLLKRIDFIEIILWMKLSDSNDQQENIYQYFGFQMSRIIFIIMQPLEAKLDFGRLVMLELILQLPCPSITLHSTVKALLNGEITKLQRLMTVSDGNSWLKTIIRRGYILVNMVMSPVPAYPKFMKQWIQ